MFSAWLWAVTLFIFFGLIVLSSFSAMHRGSDYEEARAKARMEKLKTAREEAAKALTTYGWIDKAKGAAHIPIERAMELTLADLRMKKPTTANPIATPPVPAANTAGAAGPVAQPAASGTPKPNSIEGPSSMIGGQPAAGGNPPSAPPATQPGTSAIPTASTGAPATQPAISPTGTPVQTAPATPSPVPVK